MPGYFDPREISPELMRPRKIKPSRRKPVASPELKKKHASKKLTPQGIVTQQYGYKMPFKMPRRGR